MIREIAIKTLEYIRYTSNGVNPYEHDAQSIAIDMAIKALEQEINLDKIRAEIEHHRRKTQGIDTYDLVGDCLDIIDKYKAESEDKK